MSCPCRGSNQARTFSTKVSQQGCGSRLRDFPRLLAYSYLFGVIVNQIFFGGYKHFLKDQYLFQTFFSRSKSFLVDSDLCVECKSFSVSMSLFVFLADPGPFLTDKDPTLHSCPNLHIFEFSCVLFRLWFLFGPRSNIFLEIVFWTLQSLANLRAC